MSNLEEPQNPNRDANVSSVIGAQAPSSTIDIEGQPATNTRFGVPSILWRWRREDILRKGSLALRGLAFVFSLLAFIITASNQHGPGQDFKEYEEYRYLLTISIFSSLYTGFQTLRHIHQISTSKFMFQERTSALIDFTGDQVMAYFLISSASAAIPMTDRIREGADNIFTDSSAAGISMSFFAFICLAISAIISGHKLATQSYI